MKIDLPDSTIGKTIIITCPKCNKQIEHKCTGLYDKVDCICSHTFSLSDIEGFSLLDDINNSISDMIGEIRKIGK